MVNILLEFNKIKKGILIYGHNTHSADHQTQGYIFIHYDKNGYNFV